MSFSNIISGGATSSTPSTLYGGVVLSDTTKQKRAQIKNLQDDFMTFAWGDCNAFDVFGAFILNDKKGSLKFFNGPSFSNEYSKPQFNPSGGELLGVTFQKQSISFTIGVYWISAEDYRKFLNWLSPNKTDYLYFGYDAHYRYNVKLSKRADSTKWIVGAEYVNGVKTPMYYTEIQLSFEVQGEPCAKGFNSYEFGKAEGFNWTKSNGWDYGQDGAVIKDVSEKNKTNQQTISVKGGQLYILKGNKNKPAWVELKLSQEGKSQWFNSPLRHHQAIRCEGNGSLHIQRELENNNPIYCMDSNMELAQWLNINKTVIEDRKNLIANTYYQSNTAYIKDNVDYTQEWDPENNPIDIRFNTSDSVVKQCYITKPVCIYTFGVIKNNKGEIMPRWYIESGDGKVYKGRDPEPQTPITCTYIDVSDGAKQICFQLPRTYVNKNGYLKNPENSVVWMVWYEPDFLKNIYSSAINFPGWDIPIDPQYFEGGDPHTIIQDINNDWLTINDAIVLQKDYPVTAGSAYKITGSTCEIGGAVCPHYMILNSNKEVLFVPQESDSIETDEVKIKQDGFIRLQCVKGNSNYERPLRLELIRNSKWTTVSSQLHQKEFSAQLDTNYDFIPSDLDTPFELTMPFILCQTDSAENPEYKIEAEIKRATESIKLFSVELKKLTHTVGYDIKLTKKNFMDLGVSFINCPIAVSNWGESVTLASFLSSLTEINTVKLEEYLRNEILNYAPKLTLSYNSMTGLLYLKMGNSTDQILNLLTLNDTGERVVKSCSTFKIKIPGRFSYPDFYDQPIFININITKTNDGELSRISDEFVYNFTHNQPEIICFPRTNII